MGQVALGSGSCGSNIGSISRGITGVYSIRRVISGRQMGFACL